MSGGITGASVVPISLIIRALMGEGSQPCSSAAQSQLGTLQGAVLKPPRKQGCAGLAGSEGGRIRCGSGVDQVWPPPVPVCSDGRCSS